MRLLDTRAGEAACVNPGAPLPAASTRTQPARIACAGIPAGALAVVGNATVVNTTQGAGPGYVTLFPSGAARSTVSNINYTAGQVLSNAFTVGLGHDGAFNVYAHSTTHFILDVTGYYAPPGTGGLYFHRLPQPIRLLDTRPGEVACVAPGAAIAAGTARSQFGWFSCGGLTIPNDARAIIGNATVVNNSPGSGAGYVTFYPGGATRPLVSNVNYGAGQVLSNSFTVGLGSDGTFNAFAYSTTHLIVDVTGYYSTSAGTDVNGESGLFYRALPSPFRLLDTRAGQPACFTTASPISGGTVLAQDAVGACSGIPPGTEAVVGNATVVNTAVGSAFGYVTLFPGGASRPLVSNINYGPSQVLSNAFTVGVTGPGGTFQIFPLSTTDMIIDVSGYFVPVTASRPF